jgi:hypothetical protein
MESYSVADRVKLSPEEFKLFDILKKAAQHAPKPVVMRVAGGWVRDKVEIASSDARQGVHGHRYCTRYYDGSGLC